MSGEAETMQVRATKVEGELYVRLADVAEMVFNAAGRTSAARYLSDAIELDIRRAAEKHFEGGGA